MAEMPHLESEVWQKFKDRGLILVAIGREHSLAELTKFKNDKKLTLPVAADPQRDTYAKYASKYIPRNFIIGVNGKVVFQSVGFNPQEFTEMVKTIDAELGKAK